jgi:hypothetical protein
VFCACEIERLFFEVLCVVTAAHKFDFRLLLNEITNGDRWKGHAVAEAHVLDRICVFSPDFCRECSGTLPNTDHLVYPRCAGKLNSLH